MFSSAFPPPPTPLCATTVCCMIHRTAPAGACGATRHACVRHVLPLPRRGEERRGEAAALPDRRAASFYAPLGLLRRLCPRSNPPRPDHRVPRAPDGSRGNSRGRKLRTTAVEIGDGGGGREKGQEDGGKMKEMKTKGGEKGRGRGSGSGGRILPNSHSAAELKSG